MILRRDHFLFAYYGWGKRGREEYNSFSTSTLKNSSFIAASGMFRFDPILRMLGISSLYCVMFCNV